MAFFPKCDDCGNRFDHSDQRGSTLPGYTLCPLCRALLPTFSCEWSVKNDCNGIFETFPRRNLARAALERDYADAGCYVVPSITLEIPDVGSTHWGLHHEENRRERDDMEAARRDIVAALRGRS